MKAKAPVWWRLSALCLGAVILFWLSVEDRSELPAVIMGSLIAITGASGYLVADRRHRRLSIRGHVLVGMAAGLAVPVVAALLMTLKTGLHGHGVPDYTWEQYLAVLYTTPAWLIGGGLIAAGVGLFHK